MDNHSVRLVLLAGLAMALGAGAYWKFHSDLPPTDGSTKVGSKEAAAASGLAEASPGLSQPENAERAKQLAEAKVLYERGVALEAKRELGAAREAFLQAAQLGEAKALFRCGFYAERGIGGDVNAAAARDFYEKAGQAGDADAYAALALMYIKGDAIAPDRQLAAQYIEKGLKEGSVEALFLKGVTTLDTDLAGAVACIRQAAEKNSANAQQMMARLYQDGIGVPKDEQKALEWARLAASSGSAGAQVDLARLLLMTSKLFASPAATQEVAQEATDNLLAAEEQQNARASAELLRMAMRKRPQSKEDVLNVRQLAIQVFEQGNKQTAFGVAMTYMFTQEDDKGIEWLSKGAEANDWRCKYAYTLVQSGRSLRDALGVASKATYEDFTRYRVEQDAASHPNEHQPVLISTKSPVFPPGLDIVAAKGSVLVEFIVDKNGVPTNVKALNAPHPEMAKAAEEAVAEWRFTPGIKNGKTVAARMQVPINFEGMK